MKSNICKIENGTQDLVAILKESERVAEYNGLTHKQALQLRLICEELDGMLPNIVDDFSGDVWIEYEEGTCKVIASIRIPDITVAKKEDLIDVAKNKKNASAVGIVGKIRDAVENFFIMDSAMSNFDTYTGSFRLSTGYSEGVDYNYLWSLATYRDTVTVEETEAWDELEKSVIASVADDVVVGIKGKKAEIIITKKFA